MVWSPPILCVLALLYCCGWAEGSCGNDVYQPRVKFDAQRDANLHMAKRRALVRRQALSPNATANGSSSSPATSIMASINDPTSATCINSIWPFLQVQTYPSPPFVFIHEDANGDVAFSGLAMDLLNQLAVNIGFCYNVTYLPGVRAAGSVAAVLNQSDSINLAMGTITITSARFMSDVWFTAPHFNTGLKLLTRAEIRDAGWFGFIKPISPALWGVIAGVSAIFAISLFIFERLKNHEEFAYSDPFRNVALSFFFTAEYLFTQGQFRPRTGAGRILLLGFLMMVLATIAGYTAQLAGFLTNKGLVSSVNDINGDGVLNEIDIRAQMSAICIVGNSSVESFFRREIGDTYIAVNAVFDCVTAVASGEALGFLYDEALLQYYSATIPGFMVTGKMLYKQGYGIVVSPSWQNLSEAFSMELMNLQQSGALEVYERTWIPKVAQSQENISQLTAKNFLGLFVLFLTILGLAWLWYLLRELRRGCPGLRMSKTTPVVITKAERNEILENIKATGEMPNKSITDRLLLQLLVQLSLSENTRRLAPNDQSSACAQPHQQRESIFADVVSNTSEE